MSANPTMEAAAWIAKNASILQQLTEKPQGVEQLASGLRDLEATHCRSSLSIVVVVENITPSARTRRRSQPPQKPEASGIKTEVHPSINRCFVFAAVTAEIADLNRSANSACLSPLLAAAAAAALWLISHD